MLEAAGDKVFAYDDGSVCPVIGSIAGAELNALAWQGGVDANVVLAMAGGAISNGRMSVIANANNGHLAGVLSAFADYYPILALGQAVMRIFSAITYPQAVD